MLTVLIITIFLFAGIKGQFREDPMDRLMNSPMNGQMPPMSTQMPPMSTQMPPMSSQGGSMNSPMDGQMPPMGTQQGQQQMQYPPIIAALLRQISQDSEFQQKIGVALQASQLYKSFDEFIRDLSTTALDLPIGDNSAAQRILRLFYLTNPTGEPSSNLLATPWFGSWLQDFLKAWFSFLDSPYSALALEAKLNQTSVDYRKDSAVLASGYLTFDQYYTRELLGSRRPVDNDVNSFVSPVDGCVSEVISLKSDSPRLNISGFQVNITDFFKKSQNQITDGSAIHFELDNNGYHRFHMPIDGRVLEVIDIPGEVKANLTKDSSPTSKVMVTEGDQFKFIQSRCMIVLDTDKGKMAIIAVGLIQVSSCRIYPFNKDEKLQKGDTLGYLSFGGNDVVIILDSQFQGSKDIQTEKCWKKGEKLFSLSSSQEMEKNTGSPVVIVRDQTQNQRK